jgi:hypothetical protein
VNPRLAVIIEEIDRDRADLLAVVGRIPRDRIAVRATEGGWSALEVLEHLLLVEAGTVRLLTRLLRRAMESGLPAAENTAPHDGDRIELAPIRIEAPDFVVPTGTRDPDQVLEELAGSRQALREVADLASPYDVSRLTGRHVVLGEINFYQWLSFIGAHERRHRGQVERAVQVPVA